jgi:hypothetical protein
MYFKTKNPSLDIFWTALEVWNGKWWYIYIFYGYLELKMVYWYILRPFSGRYVYVVFSHLVYFSVLVCFDQEKSGSPAPVPFKRNELRMR